MVEIDQSTAKTIKVFAMDGAGDPVTGKVDGDFTKKIAKNGGALGSMTVTITEDANGFYDLTLSASHTDTLGQLTCVFIATGVKQINIQYEVVTPWARDKINLAARKQVNKRTFNNSTNVDVVRNDGDTGDIHTMTQTKSGSTVTFTPS